MKATLKINDKEIEVEISEEELKNFEEKKPPRKRWRAKTNEEYWSGDYDVDANFVEVNDDMDDYAYSIGNYFKTKEEAEFYKNELIYTQMLKDYIYEHDDEELDWNNGGQLKYRLGYDYVVKEIKQDCNNLIRIQGAIYASDWKILIDAVKFIGEENVKKYILKVEEQE